MSLRPLESNPIYWFYGSAAIAFGVKNYAFSYLILVYSDLVLGIPAYVAGTALAIAIVWDAVSDLLLGHWSDKTRSRIGRRHPFMYASLLVFPLSFWAIFNPIIDVDETNGFFYLLIFTILIRTGTTIFEVPSVAQLPELEKDYDRRNRWLALRQTFGWYGGNGIHAINFLFWIGAYGLASQTGYTIFSTVGAILIAVVILISSLGTQKFAITLPQPSKPFRVSEIFGEIRQIFESLSNRNFASLFGYGVISGIAGGLSTALYLYNTTYFFSFSGRQIALTALGVLIAPMVAYVVGPSLGKWIGKKQAAIATLLVYICLYPIPYILLLTGHWPALGSDLSLLIYSVFIVIEVACVIMGSFFLDSMMADVVEESEINTSRRSEGLFFAARSFGAKAISAGGIIFAGTIVSLVGMDGISGVQDMTMSHRINLATLFLPLWCSLNVIAIGCLLLYQINRDDHERNLATLAQRKLQQAAT